MYCFTLYWNKLQILTWSVSWAADNEQLRDTTRLNQYSCLKGMSMTIFQNLLLPCEIDKYTKRCIPPHLGLIICTWSAAAIHGTELWAAGSISFLHSLCGGWALWSWAGCILLGLPSPKFLLANIADAFFLQTAVRLILLLSIKRLHSLHYTAKQKRIHAKKYHRGSSSCFMNAHVNVCWHESLHKGLIQAPPFTEHCHSLRL